MSSNDFPQEPYRRVRDSDPGAGIDPNMPHLWQTTDSHIVGSDQTELPLGVTPIQAAPSRRTQRRWFQVAAAAVGVLAVGLGGYLAGAGKEAGNNVAATPPAVSAAVGSTPTGPVAGAPVVIETPSVDPVAPVPSGPNAPVANGEATKDRMMYAPFGRTVFSVGDGLSTDGGSAPAWGFDATGAVTAEKAAAVAKKLGITGKPRQEFGAWTVGPNDGSGPTVSINPDGTASLNFYDPSTDPWACPIPKDGETAPECTEKDLGDAVQGDAAIAEATKLLAALGVDTDTLTFEVQDNGDSKAYSYVNAFVSIDGKRTDLTWAVGFTGAGTQSVYGFLADVVALGDYDVISPAEAVARLNDPRFGGSSNFPMPLAGVKEGMAVDDGPAVSGPADQPVEPTVPPAAEPGAPISWPVTQVTITKAELGSMLQYQNDGSTLLVPSYTLTADDGSEWTVIAVADGELDFTPSS